MFNRLLPLLLIGFCAFDAAAMNSNNPFNKNQSINIGKDIEWKIDTEAVRSTKTVGDGKGTFYHLQYDNTQLALFITTDKKGLKPKKFGQLEVKDVKVDGKQSSLFKWCLNNQQRHSRFLQQGLKVKDNLCMIDGNNGSFSMLLNKSELASLQNGNRLLVVLKPFRTPVELYYDISDFKDMQLALSGRNLQAEAKAASEKEKAAQARKTVKKCKVNPPVKYKSINPVEYICDDVAGKKAAEVRLNGLVNKEREKEKKLAAERERQRQLAEQQRQKELAEKLKREEQLKAEAAALAASEEKQARLGNEVAQKMIKVCEKFWVKGEHRCYCQKYIEFAPAEVQARAECN